MKTVKLTISNKIDVLDDMRVFSSIVRVAYNRYQDGMGEKEVRAYKKFEKGWFYPRFNIQPRDEQWKQTLAAVDDWKGLFSKIKESGLKYRFLLKDFIQNAVFSKNYIQKCYNIYTFA